MKDLSLKWNLKEIIKKHQKIDINEDEGKKEKILQYIHEDKRKFYKNGFINKVILPIINDGVKKGVFKIIKEYSDRSISLSIVNAASFHGEVEDLDCNIEFKRESETELEVIMSAISYGHHAKIEIDLTEYYEHADLGITAFHKEFEELIDRFLGWGSRK